MNPLFSFDIPKRSSTCFHHGEHLLPGMEIYSLLLEEDETPLLRRDFCAACWKEVKKDVQKKCRYWKSKIETKKITPVSSRAERALNLLRHLLNSPEQNEAEIFLLCLFLSHKRQLIMRQEFQKEGETYQLYEILRQEEYLTVKVINLSLMQIESLQQCLASKLQASSPL